MILERSMPLRRIFRVVNGGTPAAADENWGGPIPWATPIDVGAADRTIARTQRTLTSLGARTGSRIVPEGSLILSTRAPIGYVAISDTELAFNQGCRALVPAVPLDIRFFYYQLSSAAPRLQSLGQGSTFQELSSDALENYVVHVPELDEQRRIADFLDVELSHLAALERARRRQRDLLAERWQATVTKLVTRGADDKVDIRKVENPAFDAIPASWSLVPLKRRWRIIDCKHRTPTYVADGYPVVSPGDVTPGRLDLTRAHRFVGKDDFRDLADDLRRPRRGDIVYSRNASVGIAAYVDTDDPFTMGQDVCRITSADQNQLYLTHFLNSVATPQLEQMQIGSTFSRVNIGALLELQVPCPPRPEQDRIVARLDEGQRRVDSLHGLLTEQIALIAERRQALITVATTGQIDVRTARGTDE
ncbi:restriction endonuclease subunit S [Micromonospora aurantiaca]|uniref:restriction endonuclease subunit S n=1 Tax=Micromonospora aurantiaca (nom. illeg.) TaxID=47850 RepID=UPI003453ED46